jgi:hypothetical protein
MVHPLEIFCLSHQKNFVSFEVNVLEFVGS